MDKLIYLILNKKNNIDENINLNMTLNSKINYVLVDTKNTEKSYYDKKEKTVYVKNKGDKLKYSLYWIYKQKKYEYVYVINDNNDILDIFSYEFTNYKFFTDKFKKNKKTSYPISNYLIDKKCLKILLSSIDKIKITNKEISKLFIEYKIYLNKINKNNLEIEKKKNNLEIEKKENNLEIENNLEMEKKKIELKNTKILYLVLCCDNKPIYINNQKRIIEMLENAKVNYLLLKGNTESVIYNEENKTLFVDVVDVYENLPIKIYKGYEWIYNNTEYDYVYKIDDNFVFTDKNKLSSNKMYDYYGNFLVKNLDRKWHFGKCNNDELNNLEYTGKFIAPYAAGGLGYILSRKSIEILINNKDLFKDKYEIYEDKIVGDILYNNKIFVVNNLYYNHNKNTSIIKNDSINKSIIKNDSINKSIIKYDSINKSIIKYDSINKSIINYKNKDNELYTKIVGGFGNQLFMILNIIALSKKYNKNFQIYFDENYVQDYLKNKNILRKSSENYMIFKNLNFNKLNEKKLKKFEIYNEPEFKYNKIILENKKKYIINGYFQSYKYFWDYRDEIKKYLYINFKIINNIRDKFSSYGKKILSIHMRLGDYVQLKDYHSIAPIEYYKKALSYYNLDNYKIILFSDDVDSSSNILEELKINFIKADDIYTNDEEQFYMLCLSDIKICANSTFSLMSCYINDIYNFVKNPQYIFSNKWFEKNGPEYDILDLIPIESPNYKIIYKEKCAVIFFHKNIYQLYKKNWIEKCINSIINQKNVDFDIFEINYGNENISVFKNINLKKIKLNNIKHHFYIKNYETHTEAMIFLLNKIFNELNYDIIFNTNMDDYYHQHRFIYQLEDIIKNNNLANSAMWVYINENNLDKDDIYTKGENTIFYIKNNFNWIKLKDLDKDIKDLNYSLNIKIKLEIIKNNLNKKNNIINHSGICFTKKFWNSLDVHGNKLNYRDDKPYEDLSLWIRAINNGIKIGIVNKYLIYYRIHNNQIGTQKNNKDNINLKEKKTFKNDIDFTEIRKGLLVKIYNYNELEDFFNKINNLEKYHYFYFYLENSLENKYIEYIETNNIDNNTYIIFDNNSSLNNDIEIINLFDVKLEMTCDKLYIYKINEIYEVKVNNINKIDTKNLINNKTIIFYTCFYKIKSKFDINTYIEWGQKFKKALENQKVVIYTNKESIDEVQNVFNNVSNIEFVIKEFEDFELYKYIDIIEKNIDKKYFPYHDISRELILLWINRHLFLQEVSEKYKVDFYSYIDFGYFRDFEEQYFSINTNSLDENRIYLGLIKNDKEYIKEIYNILIKLENVEHYISNNMYSVGGGGNIIGKNKVDLWINYYKNTLIYFFDNKINFKDDQTIIMTTFFKNKNDNSFVFITENNNWFPFIKFLNQNNNIGYHNFDYLE
jgi:hypothetical protein